MIYGAGMIPSLIFQQNAGVLLKIAVFIIKNCIKGKTVITWWIISVEKRGNFEFSPERLRPHRKKVLTSAVLSCWDGLMKNGTSTDERKGRKQTWKSTARP